MNGVDQRAGRKNVARLSRLARERADAQARRIPWQRLLDVRNQYIDWQEFYLWVRSILEIESRIPDWLIPILNDRCPGFLENESRLALHETAAKPIYLRLEDWIDDHIFGFAKQEGWFNAISFYAVREPRCQRAQAYWSECVQQWKEAHPVRYPSFEQWKSAAAEADDTAQLIPEARASRQSSNRVPPEQLLKAVDRYIDWEAFAYWLRSALESCERLPADVAASLERESPGFLDVYVQGQDARAGVIEPWTELMRWIGDHFFQEAKAGGWFGAIVGAAQIHPRSIRTQEYADSCDEQWRAGLPVPYPTFEEWRRQADVYVELNEDVI